MHIGVLGINHKSSKLSLREKIAKAAVHCFGFNIDLHSIPLVLLSTCNRTEIYFSGQNLAQIQSYLLQLLREEIVFPFEHHLYSYFGKDCFSHLVAVTSGLDSALMFESDIKRQVKVAYEKSCLNGNLSKELHYLFQKGLKLSKGIRYLFPKSQQQICLEKTIFNLMRDYFRKLENIKILFIGNSEINRKIISFFLANGIKQVFLSTRSKSVVENEIQKSEIKIIGWEKLTQWMEYDLIICGSNSQNYLIQKQFLPKIIEKALLILDLAVPRNVDPQVGRHPNIRLLNIDELANLMNQNQKNYEQEITNCIELIREESNRQISLYHQRQNKPENLQKISEALI